MTAELGPNRYGKSAIRLVKVDRAGARHRVRDLTVAIALEGDFAASYVDGDNALVVATDTMKNTTYALAGEHLTGSIEDFATALGRHFLRDGQVERATVSIDEFAWRPIGEAPDAFVRDLAWTRTCVVGVTRAGVTVDAGIADLVVMKTSKSAFSGFPRDEFTTLAETDDRLLATKVTSTWRYEPGAEVDYDAAFTAVTGTMLGVFAEHFSVSVQASIWIIGKAIVERHPEVAEITMTLPNLHHWTADVERFGIPNDRQVYVSTTEPHGLIQATVRRS
ncbi:MAG TPA: urate oxidase [Candidatus Limnocylindrales bacterium]|nr:urate oxidase [Candidatus Limnocylindrales bacterium]